MEAIPDDRCAAAAATPLVDQPTPRRAGITRAAADLTAQLVERHGPVIFHQPGGCCDGSAPMCCPDDDFLLGDSDVLLGRIEVPGLAPTPVHISRRQHERWDHPHLTIDVGPGGERVSSSRARRACAS